MSSSSVSLPRHLWRKRVKIPDRPRSLPRPAGRPERRRLPLDFDIPIRSYLNQAFPLSIVSGNPHHRKRVFESFIQLFFPERKLDYDRVLMLPSLRVEEWESLGLIKSEMIDTHDALLRRPEALLQRLAAVLDDGRYVEVHIDEFHLPGRPCHRRIHSVHDNLLFGYDWSRGTFDLAGYGEDYEASQVGFEDLLRAFYHIPINELGRRYMRFIEPLPGGSRDFDAAAVRSQLTDYLESRATLSADQMRQARLYWKARRFQGAWGLEVYPALAAYAAERVGRRQPLDLRVTRTFWEHKACMAARLEYLESEGWTNGRLFSFAFAPVEQAAREIRFQAYEYNASGCDPDKMSDFSACLSPLKEIEKTLLGDVVAAMD